MKEMLIKAKEWAIEHHATLLSGVIAITAFGVGYRNGREQVFKTIEDMLKASEATENGKN